MKRAAIGAIGLCLLLALAACGSSGPKPGPSPTPTDKTHSAIRPEVAPKTSYQLDPVAEQRRYQALLAALKQTPGGAGAAPAANGSNFVTASACTPAGVACTAAEQRGVSLSAPGQEREVTTYTYNGPTFGEGFSATIIPDRPNQVAVQVSYSEAQGDLVGPGFEATFVWLTPAVLARIHGTVPTDYFPDDPVAGTMLTLTDAPRYELPDPAQGTIGIGADAPTLLGTLQPYLASAASFQAEADRRQEQLLARITGELAAGRVTRPADCRREGAGAPTCGSAPLTGPQANEQAQKATTAIRADEAFVAAHGPAMFALLQEALFLPACTGCWS